jgi:hypothetical protein
MVSDKRRPQPSLRSGALTPRIPNPTRGQLLSSLTDASATPNAQVPGNSDGIVTDERVGGAFKGYPPQHWNTRVK